LGERVDLASLSTTTSVDDTDTSASASDADPRADDTTTAGQRTARTVRTTTGRQIDADLVVSSFRSFFLFSTAFLSCL
jgi:hypothetical protein